jgi:hypothetical protein
MVLPTNGGSPSIGITYYPSDAMGHAVTALAVQ